MTGGIISEPPPRAPSKSPRVVIVGAGAAGLATGIFLAREWRRAGMPERPEIVLLDGARTLGAKILVSGGSRCNVTNSNVEASDFWRAGSPFVKQVLRALSVPQTVSFFDEIGVELKTEPLGKMFPVTNKARTVLDALLREASRLGVSIHTSARVDAVNRAPGGWRVRTAQNEIMSSAVVLATGGLSLPKTGSDGKGYEFAHTLGHTIVPATPALEPMILGGDFHAPLSGTTHEASIRIVSGGMKPLVIRGSLLWTHFGISGPLALNASRFFRRARVGNRDVSMTLSFVLDANEESVNQAIIELARRTPTTRISSEIARTFGLTQALATRLVDHILAEDPAIGRLSRDHRLRLAHALTAFPLPVVDGRGYNFAEVTSGGVSLDEVDPRTMESRLTPGLHFVGEILDVDGRIGGFNFQWAWSTAMVAARAIAKKL